MTLWTPKASLRLVELHAEGRSASVIANLLAAEGLMDVTRNAIIGRVHRLRLPRREPRKPATVVSRTRRQERDAERKRIMRGILRAKLMADEAERAKRREQVRNEPVSPMHITIYELTDDTCRYPYGDRPPYTYCGRQTSVGSSYCEHHDAICGTHPHGRLR